MEVAAGSKKGASDKEERELNKIFTTMEFTPDGTELLVGQLHIHTTNSKAALASATARSK